MSYDPFTTCRADETASQAADTLAKAIHSANVEVSEEELKRLRGRVKELILAAGIPQGAAVRRTLVEASDIDPADIELSTDSHSVEHPLSGVGCADGIIGLLIGPPPCRISAGMIFDAEVYPNTPQGTSPVEASKAGSGRLSTTPDVAVVTILTLLDGRRDQEDPRCCFTIDWLTYSEQRTELPKPLRADADVPYKRFPAQGVFDHAIRLGQSRAYYQTLRDARRARYETADFNTLNAAEGVEGLFRDAGAPPDIDPATRLKSIEQEHDGV